MDWTPGGLSSDVEDRRSSGGGFGLGGGGGIGIIGIVILLVLSLITGRNYIGAFLAGGGGHVASPTANRPISADEDRSAQLVSFVLDDVQKTWTQLLPAQAGRDYRHAKLVLFRDYTQSGCGMAQSQTGPFYCPADEKVYIDLGFWDELRRIGGSTGDFAQAYVVAHELGHHVQNILGVERKVRQLSSQNPSQANPLSVDLELQADCLAGVWAHGTAQRKIIDQSDVDAGLSAAAAVGDDHLQKMSRGAVSPETFTHGSSAQRTGWFKRGLEEGNISACNTFASNGQL